MEEFCEGEDALCLPKSEEDELNSELTRPLNIQEIQQLLAEGAMDNACSGMIAVPTTSFLEDFDLGVDVLDSEQTALGEFIDLSQPLKSPVAHMPGSPYQCSVPIPIQSPVGMGMPPCSPPMGIISPVGVNLNSYNELVSHQVEGELVGGFPDYDAVSSSSGITCNGSVSRGEELEMLCSICDDFDMEIGSMTLGEPHGSPAPSMDSVSSSLPTQNSLSSFFKQGGFRNLLLPSNSSPPTTPVHEKTFDFGRGTLPVHVDPDSSGIKWEGGSSSVGSCTRGSQTSDSPSRSPSPSPYHTSSPLTPSSISAPSPGATGGANRCESAISEVSPMVAKLVDMPFYQFKKIVDSGDVSETDKAMAKNIRRRGKNKVAAKNCRQRKLDMIDCLQYEIDKLKTAKVKVEVKVQSLQREIEAVRKHCAMVERSRLHS